MGELTADLFVSVDGFAAAENAGPFFGYGGPELDAWVTAELARPQTLLMGRVTYTAMAEMSASATDDGSRRMTELPKVVVSKTLTEPLSWANTTLLAGDLARLKNQHPGPLRSIGSISLVTSLMQLGLVDRLRLMLFPLTVGQDGREPAFAGYSRSGLTLATTSVLDGRLVLLEYRR